MRRRSGGALMNLLAVVAIIGIAIAFVMPSMCKSRETANRVKCQSNLSQIGKALLLYSNENKGALPRTNYEPEKLVSLTNDGAGSPDPFLSTRVNNIPSAMFLLIRTQDLTSEVFTCPSGIAEKDLMNSRAAAQRSNFTGDGKPLGDVTPNVSYGFLNVYGAAYAKPGKEPLLTAFPADFAVAADLSPVAAEDQGWSAINAKSPRATMIKGNSKNHDSDGQNVLYADGHAEFQQSPLCGVGGDNIYTAANGGTEPASESDSVLLLNYKE